MSTQQVNITLDFDAKINPEYEDLVPPLTDEEFTRLKNSISEVGLYEPIVINTEKMILDGHHRFKACKEVGVQPRYTVKHFDSKNDEEIYVIETNVIRRHLNQYQKTIMGQKLEPLYAKKAEENIKKGTLVPNGTRVDVGSIVSEKVGLSERTYFRAKQVLKNADEEILNKFKKGEIKVYSAYKNLDIKRKITELKSKIPLIPTINDLFDTIVVDPPWPYEEYEQSSFRGGVIFPTMTIDEVKNIKIPAKDDCVLWLWVTNRFMHDALHIIESWGFQQKTILTWAKEQMGVGVWLRGQTEHCILAIKGHPVWDLKGQSTLLNAPNRGHSVKPDEFYTLVESLCPGYKLDYFARKPREGWVTYGTMEDTENVG